MVSMHDLLEEDRQEDFTGVAGEYSEERCFRKEKLESVLDLKIAACV